MRIIRTPAYQGHAVPDKAGRAKGPFNPEVLADPVIVIDNGEPVGYLYNANAQNGYRGEVLYQCTSCGEVVPESTVDSHYCEVDDGEE